MVCAGYVHEWDYAANAVVHAPATYTLLNNHCGKAHLIFWAHMAPVLITMVTVQSRHHA